MEQEDLPNEVIDSLHGFDEEANQIIRSFLEPADLLPAPEIIYHYTNDAGLKGILDAKGFWFTDIFQLNDPTEIRHGIEKAALVLKNSINQSLSEHQIFYSHFEKFFDAGFEKVAHYFAFSFSSKNDDLGEWRGYADNGKGYCLGFDGKMLESIFTTLGGQRVPSNSTFFVDYDELKITRIQQAIISRMLHLISLPRHIKLSNAQVIPYMRKLSVSLAVHVLRASLTFKHHAYKPEAEYRFLQLYDSISTIPGVQLRNRNYELIRYVNFDWSAHSQILKSVMIGPAANLEKSKSFVDTVLTGNGFQNIPISYSKIPYRS